MNIEPIAVAMDLTKRQELELKDAIAERAERNGVDERSVIALASTYMVRGLEFHEIVKELRSR